MSSITEIEAAIEKLPASEVDELADWFDRFRVRRTSSPSVESWLDRSRGAAAPGLTTETIMNLTRGEE